MMGVHPTVLRIEELGMLNGKLTSPKTFSMNLDAPASGVYGGNG